MGFLILVGGVLLSLLLVWFGLRSYGQSRPASQYQTALVKKLASQAAQTPLIWRLPPSGSKEYTEVERDQNGLVKLNPSRLASQVEYKDGRWIESTSTNRPLEVILETMNEDQKPLLLFFSGKDPKALPSLREIASQQEAWKNIVFCSRQDGLLKDLRELEPRWTFCSGESYLVRLLAFSSLGLESLLEIKSDVVFIHLTTTLANKNIKKIVAEAKRQNKLVLIGPVTRPLEGLSPHGWMVENKDPKVQ